MYAEMKTTITTRVEITDDGIGGIEHSVSIDPGELPETAAIALVEGAAKTLLAQFDQGRQ